MLVVAKLTEQGKDSVMHLDLLPSGGEVLSNLLDRFHKLSKEGGFIWCEGSDYAETI
jgi:hypothetical protein